MFPLPTPPTSPSDLTPTPTPDQVASELVQAAPRLLPPSLSSSPSKPGAAGAPPEDTASEFLCAINQSCVRCPVISPDGIVRWAGGGGGGATRVDRVARTATIFVVVEVTAPPPATQVFERATVLAWLETQGSICPVSGRPLFAADLRSDPEFNQRLHEWKIRAALAQQALTRSAEEEEDIYDF